MTQTTQHTGFFGNLMAYGASEVASKASRLLVVVAVGRTLNLTEIGIAASALALGDILKSITENGAVQRVIMARDDELDATTARAHQIFWLWCVGLFLAQSALAGALYLLGGSAILSVLLVILAGEYLFMPGGLVQMALASRAGRLKRLASVAGAQIVGANFLTVALLLVWPSAFALALPRLLTAPLWLIAVRRIHPWTRNRAVAPAPLRPFIQFGGPVLGIELIKALRLQADKMIVGALMGAEALGLYFMAFNAGLSLSNSFTVAFAKVLFPHLAQSADRDAALRQSMRLALCLIAPVVVLQALLAPIYVPLLLGPGWEQIAGIVSILCLVAIPTTLWAAAAGWLRANGRPGVELWVTATLAAGVMINTVLFAPMGLTAVATGYVLTATTILVGASWPAMRAALAARPVKV